MIIKKLFLIVVFCFLSISIYSENYENFIQEKCKQYDIPVDIIIAIITVESNWQNVLGITGDIISMDWSPSS